MTAADSSRSATWSDSGGRHRRREPDRSRWSCCSACSSSTSSTRLPSTSWRPTSRHAFHLTDQSFGLIVIANLTLVLCFAVMVGHFGDRLPRTTLVVIGGILAGTFSFFTGIVGSVVLLVLVRLGNGVGQVVNDPIHTSLLSDYYPPANRPTVFADPPERGVSGGRRSDRPWPAWRQPWAAGGSPS